MMLVFSDEFNTDGRSFYPGDDPYWEAADLHYWVSRGVCDTDVGVDALCRLRIIWSGMTLRLSPPREALSLSRSPSKTPMILIFKEVSAPPLVPMCLLMIPFSRYDLFMEQILFHGRLHRDICCVTWGQ
jgi:hypothetical protein